MANHIFLVEEQLVSNDRKRKRHSLDAYHTEEEAFEAVRNIINSSSADVTWKFDFRRDQDEWLPCNAVRLIGTGTFMIMHDKKKGEKGTLTVTVTPVWIKKSNQED